MTAVSERPSPAAPDTARGMVDPAAGLGPCCTGCGEDIHACARRSALCRWLCNGWQHKHGSHFCRRTCDLASAPADISDIGPGWEVWRELRDAAGLNPWKAAA